MSAEAMALQADVTGLSVAVTGGTKGIGRAAILHLAACGAKVVFQGRDADAANSLVDACRDLPGKAHYLRGEVGSFEDSVALVDFARENFGRLDVFISSGGPSTPRPKLFVDMATTSESMEMISSRLGPRLNALHAAVPVMRKQGYGKIILMTTDAARTPTPSESMVGAAGASVMFLTRALAKELGSYGIRINAIATTLTTGTPAFERYITGDDIRNEEVITKAFQKVRNKVKFKVNDPEDIANYIFFLASPASDQISGSTISINGGLSFPGY